MIQTVEDDHLINDYNHNWKKKSWITNYSTCIWLNKIKEIISMTIEDNEDRNKCINILKKNIKNISSYRVKNIEHYQEIFIQYCKQYLNSEVIKPIELFINDYSREEIQQYFNILYRENQRSNQPKNDAGIIFINFNANKFINRTNIIEDVFFYENYYRHLFFIAFILENFILSNLELPIYEKNSKFYDHFFYIFNKKINSTIITGISLFAEFKLDYPYAFLYNEMRQLIPKNKNVLVFNTSKKNKSLKVRIKDCSFLATLLAEYRGVKTERDLNKKIYSSFGKYTITNRDIGVYINRVAYKDNDKKAYSNIRIIDNSDPYKMVVYVNLSGTRIINRLFNANGDVRRNIKAHEVVEYQYYWTDTIAAFLVWSIIKSSKQYKNNLEDLKTLKFLAYSLFVNEYFSQNNKQRKNIIPKSSIILMLSNKTKKEQEEFINLHFTNKQTKQKAFIRSGLVKIEKLKKMISSKKLTYLQILLKEIWHVYNR